MTSTADKVPPPATSADESGAMQEPTRTKNNRVALTRVLLPLGVLAAAAMLSTWLIGSKPQAQRRPAVRNAVLVDVTAVQLSTSESAIVEAMGTVRPAREVVLHPRVRGEVIGISRDLMPGGILEKGDTVLRIDPSDYQLAIKQAESTVVEAEANLRVEQGNQSIAQKEYEMLGQEIPDEERGLVLRKPQLDKARAMLETAQAVLGRAKLDLARTEIRAPFNAVVSARHIDVGTRVTETTSLVTLAGTDLYWIVVSVPVDELKWLKIPRGREDEASLVRIYDEAAWGSDAFRTGRVLRLAPDLEEEGRMAHVLVEVDDPMALQESNTNEPRMLIGSYVRVEILGVELEEVVVLDRKLLRGGNQVWILSAAGKLDIKQVEVALLRRDLAFVSGGIDQGDQIVVTDIPAPVQGMPLRTTRAAESPAVEAAVSPASAPTTPTPAARANP